jgi:phosphoribosylglycinamide formyltransferase-1
MRAFASGAIAGVLAAVVTNVADAGVLEHAERHRVPSRTIVSKGLTREAHELLLLQALEELRADHLLLAGYMRVLSPWFLSRFRGRILNIHPSLLPEFPGLHAAERQWEAGRSVAGATVHFVDGGVDTGPILLQGSIDVRGDEGPDGLAHRVLTEVEHVIYPRAVRLFVERSKESA